MAHSNLSCSFCGKRQEDVGKLVAGPTVYICNECVGLCFDVIAKEAETMSMDTTVRGSGKFIAAQPEDTLSILAFVQQHCDGRPVDSVTIGEIVTMRRSLNEAFIARIRGECKEREARVRTIAREEQARRGFEYVNLDAICANTEGLQRIRDAIQRLRVSRQWCEGNGHSCIPITCGDHTVGITVASAVPNAGMLYDAVFDARVRAGLALGAERFGIKYCDPDALNRALDLVFGPT